MAGHRRRADEAVQTAFHERVAARCYRATDSTVYCVVEGHGSSAIGEDTVAWGPRDVFVVPGWRHHRLRASDDAVLFSVSDRPVHEKLGLWREERPDAA